MHEATKGRGPGQWWPCEDEAGDESPTLYCRACAKPMGLTAQGVATGDVVCPNCGHQERVKLVGLEAAPAPIPAPEGGELPPMPHPLLIAGGGQAWYSTDQMLDYARAALAAQPQACADGTPCVDCCQANEPCRREAPSPAEGADLPPLPAPRLYCHELIENKQLNPTLADMDGIWLGCNDLNVVQRSHTPGETGEEILALYTAEQMQTYTRSALTSKVQPKGTDDWRKLAQQFDGQRMAAMAHLRTLLAMPQAHAEAARAFLAASPAEQIASVAASPAPGAASIVTDAMVDRFLGWRLPDDFSPDGGVTFNPVQYGTVTAWPSGTNLFNATQARAMLEFVHANPPQAMTREWCADFPGSAAGIINRLAQRVDELEAAAKPAPAVGATWTPTAENINALPQPVRDYIHALASNCDPAGTVADNTIKADLIRELQASNRRIRDELDTPGNRWPEARFAGYTGQPYDNDYTADQAAAFDEGKRARVGSQPPVQGSQP